MFEFPGNVWSPARELLYDKCPRAFYWRYVASSESWRPEVDDSNDLYNLRAILSIDFWIIRTVKKALHLLLEGDAELPTIAIFLQKSELSERSLIRPYYQGIWRQAERLLHEVLQNSEIRALFDTLPEERLTVTQPLSFQIGEQKIYTSWDWGRRYLSGYYDIWFFTDAPATSIHLRASTVALYFQVIHAVSPEKLRFRCLRASHPRGDEEWLIYWKDLSSAREKALKMSSKLKTLGEKMAETIPTDEHCRGCHFKEVCKSLKPS